MGGYLLQTPNLPAFSVNAKQLFYLIEKGYVEYPSLTKSDINDKNKADTLSRYRNFPPSFCVGDQLILLQD
jgi:hypothetical protein